MKYNIKQIQKGMIHAKLLLPAAISFLLSIQIGCSQLSSTMQAQNKPGTSAENSLYAPLLKKGRLGPVDANNLKLKQAVRAGNLNLLQAFVQRGIKDINARIGSKCGVQRCMT